jgi:hypothetical protein
MEPLVIQPATLVYSGYVEIYNSAMPRLKNTFETLLINSIPVVRPIRNQAISYHVHFY